jgi:NAD+ kinase
MADRSEGATKATAAGVRRPRRVGLVSNLTMEAAIEACQRALPALEAEGAEVVLEEHLARRLGREGGAPQSAMEVDILVVSGGDGTILNALHQTSAPVLAINTGSVGFLAELAASELEQGMHRLMAGEWTLEERMRIKSVVNGHRSLDAMNEVVVHTAVVSKMMTMELRIDGEFVDRIRADGLIVATPTGSTSYAMSTGGPIVDPRLRAMVLSPLAPFNLHSRPMVVPSCSMVEVSATEERYPGLAVIDGQHEIHFRTRTIVELTESESPARFVRMGGTFYERLRQKFISVYPGEGA